MCISKLIQIKVMCDNCNTEVDLKEKFSGVSRNYGSLTEIYHSNSEFKIYLFQ